MYWSWFPPNFWPARLASRSSVCYFADERSSDGGSPPVSDVSSVLSSGPRWKVWPELFLVSLKVTLPEQKPAVNPFGHELGYSRPTSSRPRIFGTLPSDRGWLRPLSFSSWHTGMVTGRPVSQSLPFRFICIIWSAYSRTEMKRPSIQMLGLFICLGLPAPGVGGGRDSWPPPTRLGRIAEFGALPSYVPAPLMGIVLDELPEEVLRIALVQVNDLHSVPLQQFQSVSFGEVL